MLDVARRRVPRALTANACGGYFQTKSPGAAVRAAPALIGLIRSSEIGENGDACSLCCRDGLAYNLIHIAGTKASIRVPAILSSEVE